MSPKQPLVGLVATETATIPTAASSNQASESLEIVTSITTAEVNSSGSAAATGVSGEDVNEEEITIEMPPPMEQITHPLQPQPSQEDVHSKVLYVLDNSFENEICLKYFLLIMMVY